MDNASAREANEQISQLFTTQDLQGKHPVQGILHDLLSPLKLDPPSSICRGPSNVSLIQRSVQSSLFYFQRIHLVKLDTWSVTLPWSMISVFLCPGFVMAWLTALMKLMRWTAVSNITQHSFIAPSEKIIEWMWRLPSNGFQWKTCTEMIFFQWCQLVVYLPHRNDLVKPA